MTRILLTVSYDGTAYAGFQLQPTLPTVAGKLNAAVSRAYGATLSVRGASRTDAGVHALGQRATLNVPDALALIPLDKLPRVLNSHLPPDIAVSKAEAVADTFNVVTQARRKTYRYRIYCAETPNPLERLQAYYVPRPLDLAAMREAAACFIGKRDFAACMAVGGKVKTTVREVYALELSREGALYTMTVTGGGFLYNMVRIIAGTLCEAGFGRLTPADIEAALLAKDRTRLGRTAAARGLTLMSIEY